MLIHLSLFCFGVTAGILIQFLLCTLPALRTVTRWQNHAMKSLELAEKVLKYAEQFGHGFTSTFTEDPEEDWEQHVDEGFLDDQDEESLEDGFPSGMGFIEPPKLGDLPDTMKHAKGPLYKEKPPEEDIDTLI